MYHDFAALFTRLEGSTWSYTDSSRRRERGGRVATMISRDIEVLICGDMKRTVFEACLEGPAAVYNTFLSI